MQILCYVRTRQHPLPVWSHKFVISSLTHFSTNSHPFLVGIVSSNDPLFSDDDAVFATPKKWNGSSPKPNRFHLTPSQNHAFQCQKAESIVQCSGAADPNQENKNPNSPPLFFQNFTGGYHTSLDSYAEEGFLNTQEDSLNIQESGLFDEYYD